MKQLHDLLKGISLLNHTGAGQVGITAITADSRQAGNGILFAAIRGTQVDGHSFIPQVLEAGSPAIVAETDAPADFESRYPDRVWLKVASSSFALGHLASAFHGHPSHRLQIVAVTGTNGKTTTATLLYQLFMELGYTCGLLSTVENRIGSEVLESTHTTPDAVNL